MRLGSESCLIDARRMIRVEPFDCVWPVGANGSVEASDSVLAKHLFDMGVSVDTSVPVDTGVSVDTRVSVRANDLIDAKSLFDATPMVDSTSSGDMAYPRVPDHRT